MSTCAIIPAAGRGTRLNTNVPKIMIPIAGIITIWDILYKKLYNKVDAINIILNPAFASTYRDAFVNKGNNIYLSIQEKPIGMGDAIFSGYEIWGNYDNVIIIWGDQVHVSNHTLENVMRIHTKMNGPNITLPLTRLKYPYVEYEFDKAGKRLVHIYQSREGDNCTSNGLSDIGVFCLNTKKLRKYWHMYLKLSNVGELSKEINFLPFLVFLSKKDWEIERYFVKDSTEARGINTREDLDYFKRLYNRKEN